MSAADVSDALARVQERIDAAAGAAGRAAGEVRLLLATKTQPPDVVRAAVLAARAGAARADVLVGENRVQELTAKAAELADLGVTAHLIGGLQSNKINAALRSLGQHGGACVETLDSLELATRLSDRVAAAGAVPATPLDVMIQVNVSGEESKAGVSPDAAADLAGAVAVLPGLRLTGFMTIAARTEDEGVARGQLARLRTVRDGVLDSRDAGTHEAVELSMGMSGDLEWAVAEGSTIVRVGSAVFGARPPA